MGTVRASQIRFYHLFLTSYIHIHRYVSVETEYVHIEYVQYVFQGLYINQHLCTVTEYDVFQELNINRYATKKTVAKGLLDVALLSANASQLKVVLSSKDTTWSHYLVLTLISISIFVQVSSSPAQLSSCLGWSF